jgi:Domain of unknown function (DUF1992)
MNSEERRRQRLQLQDDHIGRALRESEASGELRAAPSYGRPLATDTGYEQTPDELRLPFKILKDAGVVPPEVEVMREISALQQQLAATADPAAQRALQQRIAEKRQHLALRLERLRATGSL